MPPDIKTENPKILDEFPDLHMIPIQQYIDQKDPIITEEF
jgi:hypothetical protein